MKIIKDKLLQYNNISHGFTTRKNGFSDNPYSSLNCSHFVGDHNKNVLKNRKLILKKLSLSSSLFVKQIHSNRVLKSEDIMYSNEILEADALTSMTPGLGIFVTVADCAPILFADINIKMVAVAHAGWRGAVKGITDNVITEFLNHGSKSRDISVVIGPCIGPSSYEVGIDMKSQSIKLDPSADLFFHTLPNSKKSMFDLPGYLIKKMKSKGVEKICWTGEDTYKEPEKFFSYRYSKIFHDGLTGRMIGAIGLK